MTTLTAAQTQFVQTGSTMATVAYGNGATPPAGFVLLNDPITHLQSIDSTSGFSAQTYVNTATSEIFVAIAGTNDIKDAVHGWSSAYLGWNTNAAQLTDALTYGKQLQDFISTHPEYTGYSISSAGHSLAESFSQMYTYTFGWKGVGFDGVGAGSIINSAGYDQTIQQLNIDVAHGTEFISCNTSGLGINVGDYSFFGGGGVGSTGFNIEGTTSCQVDTSAGVAFGGLNAIASITLGVPGYLGSKLFGLIMVHSMADIINPAVQQGHFSVDGSIANTATVTDNADGTHTFFEAQTGLSTTVGANGDLLNWQLSASDGSASQAVFNGNTVVFSELSPTAQTGPTGQIGMMNTYDLTTGELCANPNYAHRHIVRLPQTLMRTSFCSFLDHLSLSLQPVLVVVFQRNLEDGS